MAIVKFQQDTEKPFGTGNFVDDKGKSTYLTDPDTASKFVDTLPGQGGAGLAGKVGAETNAIATKQLGSAQPTKGPDLRLASNMTDSFEGVGGSTATDAAASPGAVTAPPPAPLSDVQAVGNVASPSKPFQNITAALALGGPKPPPAGVAAPGASATAPGAPVTPSAAPAAPGAPLGQGGGVLGLAGETTVTGGSTVKGRDKKLAQADANALEKTGAETDTAILGQGTAADERATGALDKEREGVSAEEERNRNQVIDEKLKQQSIADAKAKLDAELKANDEKLDPEQYMKRMSSGKKLGMVILAALNGGFGSLIGQKENGVLSQVDDAINQNIAKQKQEIADGHTRIGNDIAELMRKGHDAETAEQVARDRANTAVDKMFQLDAKRMGIQGVNAEQAQLLVKQRQEARTAQRAQIMKETEDRATSQWQKTQTYQEKQAGGKPLTAKEYYETLQAELNYRNAALDSGSAADVANAIGKPVSPQEAQRIKDRAKEVGAGVNETSGAVNMTKNAIESLGGKLDETTGKITWPSDMSGVGLYDEAKGALGKPFEKLGWTYTDRTKALDAQAALVQYITSNLTGATASPEQLKTFTAMAGADLSNEDRAKSQLQNWANTLFSLRNDQMARLGPDGQKYFAWSQEQAKKGAGAAPLQTRAEQPMPGAPAAAPAPAPVPTQPVYTPNNPLQLVARR